MLAAMSQVACTSLGQFQRYHHREGMIEMSAPSCQEIISDLVKNNICHCCCLRFINKKDRAIYSNVDKYMKRIFSKKGGDENECELLVKKKKLNPCSACLGLLQVSENNEIVNKIANEINSEGHDSDDVTFALSLPISILLRDYSVWLYVSNKYSKFFDDAFNVTLLEKQTNIASIKEVWKWMVAQPLADKLGKRLNNGVNGSFRININITYEMDDSETSCLLEMFPEIFNLRSVQKRKFHGEILTRKSVESALLNVDLNYFSKFYSVPPGVPDCFVKCSIIECLQDSIYIAGRYNKFSRKLSQTPWVINGERRMESSVEEIIAKPISNLIKHDGIKFSSSGREDVDVRTLGNGRPFILEVVNPRKTKITFEDMRALEDDINRSTKEVFVRDLQLVRKEDLAQVKTGEQSRTKTYNCYCLVKMLSEDDCGFVKNKLEKLKEMNNLVIDQKTPIRVLHRRSLAVRPRTVFWLKADFHRIEGNHIFFMLALQVEAGTYVKEFIHGDFGRTKPNLSEILGRETDILALDVEEVALHWPPSL